MRHTAAGIVLAATVLLSATGCSLISDAGTAGSIVYDDAASELTVQRLKATLEDLPGVDGSTVDFDAFGKTGREAVAEIDAPTATAPQLVAIAQAVREAFGNPDLGVTEPIATISAADESILTMAAFAMKSDDLVADVTYWWNLRAVLETTTYMELRETPEGYQRFIVQPGEDQFTAEALRDSWPAVLALEDSSLALKSWSLPPGLEVSGSLPDQATVNVLADLAEVGPAIDGVPTSDLIFFDLAPRSSRVFLSMSVTPPAGGITSHPDWPRVGAAAELAVTSAIPISEIGIVSAADEATPRQGFVFLEPCATASSIGDGDAEFFEALVAAGVPLPEGSGPGRCAR